MAELILGRLKFNWKGNWTTTTAYIKDDVVKYGPSAWVCIANHTSTNEFNFNNFQLMAEGVSWAGEWNDATSYQVNDIVNYGGAIYVCVLDHAPGDSTDTSPNSLDFWQRLVGGLEWESDYNSGETYQRGDIVRYGGYTYINLQTSTNVVPTNTQYWDILNRGYIFVGEYTAGNTYLPGQLVRYGGKIYSCTVTATNSLPTLTDFWFLFSDGIKWRNEWSASSVGYVPGDIAKYGARTYICILSNTSDSVTFIPTNATYWNLLTDGQQWSDVWSASSMDYKIGDIVRYGARSYVCVLGHVSDNSANIPTNETYWALLNKGLGYTGTWNVFDFSQTFTVISVANPAGSGAIYQIDGGNRPVLNLIRMGVYTFDQSDASNVTHQIAFKDSAGNSYTAGVVTTGAVGTAGAQTVFTVPSNAPADLRYYCVSHGNGMGNTIAVTGTGQQAYKLDDVVEYSGSAYVCIQAHSTAQTPNTATSYWNALAVGDISSPMTTTGDMIYRNAGGAIVRLPVGASGAYLVVNNGIPAWGTQAPERNYYVSLQGNDANDGRTPATAWRTLAHACAETFNLGQTKISLLAGTYTELCPIKLGREVCLEGDALGAVTVSPDNSTDKGFGVGISRDGSTPNVNSEVFQMNNGSRLRNVVFRGFGNGAVCVSLDPGTGPNDTSVWIASQSPYVQNCTSFTDLGTGMVIDGALHNGGNRSIVANDWTQINSDGVGFVVKNDGRSELVSCFTYYCNIGYLCEGGGRIRSLSGNNSYGEYGAVARGFSQTETPLTGNLQLSDDTVTSVQTFTSNVHIFTSYRNFTGNLFCVGHTNPTGTDATSSWSNSTSRPFIAKFTAGGDLDWSYTYTSSYGAVHSIVEIDNSYYAGGVVYDGGQNKGFLIKISSSGEIQWQKTVGSTDEIVDVASDDNSFIYAVGNHTTNGVTVLRVQPSGIVSWSRTLDYNDSSINTLTASSICYAGTPTTSTDSYGDEGDATAEDDLYIACRDTTANVAMIVRMNNLGSLVTAYNYGNWYINKLRLDTGNGDGIYMMAVGYYDPAGAATKNPLAMRISMLGDVVWQSQVADTADSTQNGEWRDVLPIGDDVYVCGYINDSDSTLTFNRGLVARLTSNGAVAWTRTFTTNTDDVWLTGIALDGVNIVASGNYEANSVVVNIQRDLTGGLGTVTSESWTLSNSEPTLTADTVATKSVQNIYAQSPTISLTDTSLTLNQSPGITRTTRATRTGFAGIGPGISFTVTNISRSVKEGSVLQIQGNTNTYFVIGVANFDSGTQSCTISIDPSLPSNLTPNDNTPVVFREAFSQVRMTGHDFLDIGSGGFADTNYPVIISSDYVQQPSTDREVAEENGGRCFYVTTDQDGNFRVGNYFKVEQSTGRATLSSEEFDLSGLNELQLGSITAGRSGATVNEFSTDGTFADNSDTAVPTERATKTYVDTAITGAVGAATTLKVGANPNISQVEVVGTGTNTDTVTFDINGNEVAQIGAQHIKVPSGSTANRPGSPANGYIRYNTDLNVFEGYVNSAWSGIGGGNPWATKTSAYTAANNDRLFVDTSSTAVTITLPASPTVGDSVRIIDLSATFDTNNLTIARNSSKIMGLEENLTVSTENAAIGLVYTGATQGWKLIEVI